VSLCLCLAAWVSGLVLFESEHTFAIADARLAVRMLLAGGFVHAGADVVGMKSRRPIVLAYAFGPR